MVSCLYGSGAEDLNIDLTSRRLLEERLVLQLRMISKGAYYWYRREQERLALHNEGHEEMNPIRK